MSAFQALIDDLDAAVATGSQDKRVEILRRVTDLFVGQSTQITALQTDVFDQVLGLLIQKVESTVLAELGTRLAPVDNAPHAVIQKLARHDEIAVAGPVLSQATQLTDQDLVEIARTKSQDHLGAISDRSRVAAVVSDILVERGNSEVLNKVTRNHGAAFSQSGFATLTKHAMTDERLAGNLGLRVDVPPQVLQELMAQVTEAVKRRLTAVIPGNAEATDDIFAAASSKVLLQTATIRDFRHAEALVTKMQQANELTEKAILEFANTGRYEELVAGLARLNSAPLDLIESLMQNSGHEGVLVACKAAELHWSTLVAILTHRFAQYQPSPQELDQAKIDFLKLSVATARRMFRFWLVRGISKAPH